jgi:competence protein ComFC
LALDTRHFGEKYLNPGKNLIYYVKTNILGMVKMWQQINTYQEFADSLGRVKSRAWYPHFYPDIDVPVLGVGPYFSRYAQDDAYSAMIVQQKKYIDLSKEFMPQVIRAVDAYSREFQLDEIDEVTLVPRRDPAEPLRPTVYSIAKEVAKHLNKSFSIMLERTELREKCGESAAERFKANDGNIRCTESNLKGKRILLVDDVKTTGVTMLECTKMLKLAGARETVGLCLGVHVKPEEYEACLKKRKVGV